MSKRASTALAGFALVGCLAIFSGMLYLMFIFPRTESHWAQLGRELTVFEQGTIELSGFCRQFGFFILPFILLLVAGSLAWLIISRRTKHQAHC